MIVVLGLLAAVLYGISDFVGGVNSRRYAAATVLLYSSPIGAVLMIAMLPLFGGSLHARGALFGVLGGVSGLVGVMLLYSVMTVAPINVVSPVTAVLAAAVPLLVGIGIGERPGALAWSGIALGLVAVVLVSRTAEGNPHGRIKLSVLTLAVVSGLGFGLYFVFLARAGDDSGLWPLVISRCVSAALMVPIALSRQAVVPLRGRALGLVAVTGACDALANLAFLEASRHGLLSVASVLTSLYPATTVLLAMWLLKEHAGRVQRIGLGLAAASVVLITV